MKVDTNTLIIPVGSYIEVTDHYRSCFTDIEWLVSGNGYGKIYHINFVDDNSLRYVVEWADGVKHDIHSSWIKLSTEKKFFTAKLRGTPTRGH